MSRRRFKTNFEESLYQNSRSKTFYYDRLMELSISMFEWKNMPEEIDTVFLERTLFTSPYALFFKDDALGENGRYLALKMTYAGGFDVYRRPTKRRAYAVNGYNIERDETNSVIIYNNMIRTNACDMVRIYSDKLWEIDRAIDVNARAQKTPVLIKCTEQQRLTLQNVYKEFDGNAPVIYADNNLDLSGVSCIRTDAPYVADKLYTLKTQLWNECLTYLGISNVNSVKKERMITDEVARNQGGTIASRYSRLNARKQACEQINKMFGLDIDVDYRDDFDFTKATELATIIDEKGGDEDE